MTRKITTYNDLLEEKQRLESLLKVQKTLIKEDIEGLKEELKPVGRAVSVAGKFFTRDNHNLLINAGTNTLIDIFIKKFILSRTGWITKLVVPFILKNYSSHFISEKKGSILKKLFSFIGKKNAHANGQEKVKEN